MKNIKVLLLFLLVISLLGGILVSQMSWIGRLGINFAYKEYTVFKSWWKTFLLFLAIQYILVGIQYLVSKNTARSKTIFTFCILLIIGVLGLFATFRDFTHTFSHKILNEKFHLGFYLFWLGWIVSNIYFIITPAPLDTASSETPSK